MHETINQFEIGEQKGYISNGMSTTQYLDQVWGFAKSPPSISSARLMPPYETWTPTPPREAIINNWSFRLKFFLKNWIRPCHKIKYLEYFCCLNLLWHLSSNMCAVQNNLCFKPLTMFTRYGGKIQLKFSTPRKSMWSAQVTWIEVDAMGTHGGSVCSSNTRGWTLDSMISFSTGGSALNSDV